MLIAPCTAQSTDKKHKIHPEMPNKTHNATKVHLKMFFECSYYRLESPPIYILYSSTLYCTVDDIRHNLIPPKPCGWLAFHLFDGVSMLTIVVSWCRGFSFVCIAVGRFLPKMWAALVSLACLLCVWLTQFNFFFFVRVVFCVFSSFEQEQQMHRVAAVVYCISCWAIGKSNI